MRRPSPHLAVHCPQSAQLAQEQYSRSWHCRGQAPTSSATKGSQGLPPCLGYRVMCRKRVRWPPHLPQAPQSCHWPYSQSTGAGPGQAAKPHCLTMARAPSHGLPPLAGAFRTSLRLACSPPPQLAVQSPQSVHSVSRQSTGGCAEHAAGVASPGPGLQGHVSLSGPLQKAPWPEPYCRIRRVRLLSPLQVVEQSLQPPHSEKTQS
mmetsp:Transcript_63086/g.195304  ORF Transcript_63086/g.195304 Transcript_63086/m.195304 type:complete len:206 (-) Transcript_63086:596-1213(-)